MTKSERRWIFAKKLSALILLADWKDIRIIPYCIHRSPEEQNQQFREGKSLCDGYVKISKHQTWEAADVGILNDDMTEILWDDQRYHILGKLGEAIGLTWGYRWFEEEKTKFKDWYHFELP